MPHGTPCAAVKAICSRSAELQASRNTLPYGSSSTRLGIKYSNIEPDHERNPATVPIA